MTTVEMGYTLDRAYHPLAEPTLRFPHIAGTTEDPQDRTSFLWRAVAHSLVQRRTIANQAQDYLP